MSSIFHTLKELTIKHNETVLKLEHHSNKTSFAISANRILV